MSLSSSLCFICLDAGAPCGNDLMCDTGRADAADGYCLPPHVATDYQDCSSSGKTDRALSLQHTVTKGHLESSSSFAS